MRIIIAILAFAIGALLVGGFVYTLKQPSNSSRREVCLPKKYSYIGSGSGILFLILTLVCAFSNEPVILAFLFLCITAVCGLLVLMYINRRISYDDDGFVVKNIFGKTEEYNYSDITGRANNVTNVALYIDDEKISIDTASVGMYKFLDAASKGYEMEHGEKIPPHKKRNDLFNGNIKGSSQIFWGYVVMYIVLFFFLIVSILVTYSKVDPESTESFDVSLSSFGYSGNNMDFYTSDGQKFQLRHLDDWVDRESLEMISDGATSVRIYATFLDAKDGDDYYVIRAITLEDKYVISFDQTDRLDKNVNQAAIVFAVLLIFLWSAFVIFSIIVGRNPDNYSRKVVYFFFRRDYIDR